MSWTLAEWREDPAPSRWRFVPVGAGLLIGAGLASVGPLSVALVAGVVGVVAELFLRALRPEVARVRDLAPEPGERARLVRYEAGHDVAVLEIVDGWLVARGARADWALRPRDVISHTREGFQWRTPDGRTGMVRTGSDLRRRDAVALVRAGAIPAELFPGFAAWEKGPDPLGAPVFPPSRPTRIAVADARDAAVALTFHGLLIALSFEFQLLTIGKPGMVCLAIGLGFAAFIPAAGALLRWRELGVRRRA